MIKIPGTPQGLPADRGVPRRRAATSTSRCSSASRTTSRSRWPTSALSRRALKRGAADRPHRLRRQLLRQPRRHARRQEARREDRGRAATQAKLRSAEGQGRRRQRQDRLRKVQGDLLRRALGGAGGEGRARAALPLGQHQHQEPRLPRRHLRRGADRPAHDQHDAAGHPRRLPRPRRSSRDTLEEGVDDAFAHIEALADAGIDLRAVTDELQTQGVKLFVDSFEKANDTVAPEARQDPRREGRGHRRPGAISVRPRQRCVSRTSSSGCTTRRRRSGATTRASKR